MNKRITLQDIANELGISRNTVSRALNQTGAVSEETRIKICETARQMGYKQFIDINENASFAQLSNINIKKELLNNKDEIALFTQSFPGGSHSGTKLLEAFQKEMDEKGYKLSIHIIRQNEIDGLVLPSSFNPETTAGILCIELFAKEYSNFLSTLGYPLLFIDTALRQKLAPLNADLLYMENLSSSYHAVTRMIEKNCKNIAFVGDNHHCQSFYERWQGYCSAMLEHDLPLDKSQSILADDKLPYADADWLSKQIAALDRFPDAFFCANDFLAISVLKAIKLLGKTVPKDALLCGFDNAQETILVEPALTTVHIPSEDMGHLAAKMLIERINNPALPYRMTYVSTQLVMRDSL